MVELIVANTPEYVAPILRDIEHLEFRKWGELYLLRDLHKAGALIRCTKHKRECYLKTDEFKLWLGQPSPPQTTLKFNKTELEFKRCLRINLLRTEVIRITDIQKFVGLATQHAALAWARIHVENGTLVRLAGRPARWVKTNAYTEFLSEVEVEHRLDEF